KPAGFTAGLKRGIAAAGSFPGSLPAVSGRQKSIQANIDLWEEYRALGFLRSHHPLILWKDSILPVKRVKAIHINDYVGKFVQMIGWPVTQKEVWTRDGQTMSFLSLEDETALYETVVFPQIYKRYHKLLFDQIPLLVWGKVTDDNGAIIMELERIASLERRIANHFSSCYTPVNES
ncbi:MAG: hypothetical protein FWD78_17210, partial [Treponema sp.]|nr:hypothetical protein [Treponema sp.]